MTQSTKRPGTTCHMRPIVRPLSANQYNALVTLPDGTTLDVRIMGTEDTDNPFIGQCNETQEYLTIAGHLLGVDDIEQY